MRIYVSNVQLVNYGTYRKEELFRFIGCEEKSAYSGYLFNVTPEELFYGVAQLKEKPLQRYVLLFQDEFLESSVKPIDLFITVANSITLEKPSIFIKEQFSIIGAPKVPGKTNAKECFSKMVYAFKEKGIVFNSDECDEIARQVSSNTLDAICGNKKRLIKTLFSLFEDNYFELSESETCIFRNKKKYLEKNICPYCMSEIILPKFVNYEGKSQYLCKNTYCAHGSAFLLDDDNPSLSTVPYSELHPIVEQEVEVKDEPLVQLSFIFNFRMFSVVASLVARLNSESVCCKLNSNFKKKGYELVTEPMKISQIKDFCDKVNSLFKLSSAVFNQFPDDYEVNISRVFNLTKEQKEKFFMFSKENYESKTNELERMFKPLPSKIVFDVEKMELTNIRPSFSYDFIFKEKENELSFGIEHNFKPTLLTLQSALNNVNC